tara:strand:+ start:1178 stop:2605 length:1428 start_codon:yes stop_codon:yes gene_type:complete
MDKVKLLIISIVLLVPTLGECVANESRELSIEQKGYGVSLFWKEASYNFAYFDQVEDLDWDATYISYLSEAKNTKNNFEYYRLLSRFAAELNDGMTFINFPENLVEENIDFPRVKLAEADGDAVIIAVDNELKGKIVLGSIVLEVDGRSTQNVLEKDVFPYISSSTYPIKIDRAIKGSQTHGYGLLAGKPNSIVSLKLKRPDGVIETIELERNLAASPVSWYSSNGIVLKEIDHDESMTSNILENDIFYIAINNFTDIEIVENFKALIPTMKRAKGLILDLRFNRGGNTMIVEDILKHLTFHDLTGAKSKMRVHNATFKAWGKYANDYGWAKKYESYFLDEAWNEIPPDVISSDEVSYKDKVVIPTVILIGRNTSSAAENFLIYAEKAENFTTIGEPTFGSTGEPLIIELPGGGSAKICTKRDTYPDGRDFVGYGIKPDILVSRDISYYLSNVDLLLQVALKQFEMTSIFNTASQ